jgi:hypothetical protein
MLTVLANEDSRFFFWPRVREFAVPPSMIETATARRQAGDWAGACAAANFDIDFNLRFVARSRGRDLATLVRDDLRRLAPDLLRWHLPRIAPDGLLRPGVTIALARYDALGRAGEGPVHLVARTPPAWADAGQRISLALWDGSLRDADAHRSHPHPHPDRRFRLDLHPHLWDASRAGDLRIRSGADRPPADDPPQMPAPRGRRWAVDRWAAEARILLAAEGQRVGPVGVRLGGRHRRVLEPIVVRDDLGPPGWRFATDFTGDAAALPVLPDAATWVLPDLDLIRAGVIEVDRLHPLVAAALVPDRPATRSSPAADRDREPRVVECRGARHRIGVVDGVLTPLDHDPAQIRREELLAALSGTPLPCLQVIDEAHRRPDCLFGVRERLDHGDIAGALAVVDALLGPDAVLRSGPLRDELENAVRRRTAHGLYRAGLAGPGPHRFPPRSRRFGDLRSRPRYGTHY